jgi:hypothetical protein
MTRTLSIIVAGLSLAACSIPAADKLPAEPTISGFTSSLTDVSPGTTVTLSWVVSNAVSVHLEEALSGQVISLAPDTGAADAGDDAGTVDAGTPNSIALIVRHTSVFVLTATNARGASTTASVTVNAGGTPADLFFLAAPGVIHSGDSAMLVWNTPGVNALTLTAAPGGSMAVDQSSAGSVAVTPEFPTTYTLEAGGASRALTLAVLPTIDAFTAVAANSAPDAGVADGGVRVHLTWTTRGARSVRVSVDGREVALLTGAGQVGDGAYDDLLAVSDPGRVYAYQLAAANDAGVELSTAAFP